MRVTLIGAGPAGTQLIPEAVKALERAQLIVGSRRLIDAVQGCSGKKAAVVKAREAAELIAGSSCEECAVLLSGDTGFYSGASLLLCALEEKGITPYVLPGISSVQLLAARLGRPWQDWTLLSAHGASPDLLKALSTGKPVFLLTSGGEQAAEICAGLALSGLGDLHVTVAEELGTPGERITGGKAEEMAKRSYAPLNVMLLTPEARHLPLRRHGGIEDSLFVRGEIPMTKMEVRALILSKLSPAEQEVCWDIGTGSGSVAVELALFSRECWAVDQKQEACDIARKNRERFRVWNMKVLCGRAPQILEQLPVPDAVFVGGSGGQMKAILDRALEANPKARFCVSAITLETLEETLRWMKENGTDYEITSLTAARHRKAGDLTMMIGGNPVYVISGRKP